MRGERMEKRDILLYFIYAPVENSKLLSPIQIMKGLFLIKQELKLEDFYEFEPYLYGPCSFEVYRDLEILTKERLITQVPSGGRWFYYRITPLGKDKIKEILKTMDEKLAQKILELKKFVAGKSLFELLHYVYKKYPEYAKNSIINLEVLIK
jgi:DNA-binding PadR family transcriptional regulator